MKAAISNYRRGRHAQKGHQAIIVSEGVKSRKDAEALKGRDVTYTTPGKRAIRGKVSGAHGNKGAFRAIFEKGLPGQSLGSAVEISG